MKNLIVDINSECILKRLFIALLCVELLILVLDITLAHHKLTFFGELKPIRLFLNMTREDSFPNWFSSIQAFFVGLVGWTIAYGLYKDQETKKFRLYGWIFIALFFSYMGIDDGAMLHERMGSSFDIAAKKFGGNEGGITAFIGSFPTYTWQLVMAPAFVMTGVFILWFLWKESSNKTMLLFLFAAISLYGLAVIIDFIEGLNEPYYAIADFFGTTFVHMLHYSKAFEEFIEMFGTTCFLLLFLKKLFSLNTTWQINIKEEDS